MDGGSTNDRADPDVATPFNKWLARAVEGGWIGATAAVCLPLYQSLRDHDETPSFPHPSRHSLLLYLVDSKLRRMSVCRVTAGEGILTRRHRIDTRMFVERSLQRGSSRSDIEVLFISL